MVKLYGRLHGHYTFIYGTTLIAVNGAIIIHSSRCSPQMTLMGVWLYGLIA